VNPKAAIQLARDGRLYPALILHGSSGEDRQRFALELARTLLCERSPGKRPCGKCPHCRRVMWPEGEADTFHPDFTVLERDLRTVTSVAAAKSFLRGAQLSPFEARGQVFVIANAETLSGGAANALLKTLEEPPTSAPRHFLLLAPSQLDLLPTLRSRSLALFLGAAARPRDEQISDLALGFSAALVAFGRKGNRAELLAASSILKQAGSWNEPRAMASWERAAAVVVEASAHEDVSRYQRRAMLHLAADLLRGPSLRVRGIQAERILDGFVSRRLESSGQGEGGGEGQARR